MPRDRERETRLRGSDGIQLGGAVIWKIRPNAEDVPLLARGRVPNRSIGRTDLQIRESGNTEAEDVTSRKM
jgi:hypothetical protein